MKRNTTPTLPIKINMPFENVTRIEFIFKKNASEYATTLLHKVFEDEIPVRDGDTSEGFIVDVRLTAEETMRLTVGEVYMDTRIVLTDNLIPATKIVKIDVKETLFREVYRSD